MWLNPSCQKKITRTRALLSLPKKKKKTLTTQYCCKLSINKSVSGKLRYELLTLVEPHYYADESWITQADLMFRVKKGR